VQTQTEKVAVFHERQYGLSPIYPALLKVIANGTEQIIHMAEALVV